MWRGGCIIRSAFLGKIKEAFDRNPKLTNLLLDPYFKARSTGPRPAGGASAPRRSRTACPIPAMTSALAYLRRLPHASASPPISSRPSATTSAPTPTSASTAARSILPHQLDRPRRHDGIDDV